MERREVVNIIFYDEDKRILLEQRPENPEQDEEWSFFAEDIEDESAEERLKKMVRRNFSYQLEDFEYLGEVESNFDFYDKRHVFVSSLTDKLTRFMPHPEITMDLFTVEEAKSLDMLQGDKKVLDVVRDYLD